MAECHNMVGSGTPKQDSLPSVVWCWFTAPKAGKADQVQQVYATFALTPAAQYHSASKRILKLHIFEKTPTKIQQSPNISAHTMFFQD